MKSLQKFLTISCTRIGDAIYVGKPDQQMAHSKSMNYGQTGVLWQHKADLDRKYFVPHGDANTVAMLVVSDFFISPRTNAVAPHTLVTHTTL